MIWLPAPSSPGPPFPRHSRAHQLAERSQLILRQGLGWEQVEGAGVGLGQQTLEYGQVVAQRLAAGGRGHDRYMFAAQRRSDGRRLVRK